LQINVLNQDFKKVYPVRLEEFIYGYESGLKNLYMDMNQEIKILQVN